MTQADVILIHAPGIYEDPRVTLLPLPQDLGKAPDNCFLPSPELLEVSSHLAQNGYSAHIVDLPELFKRGSRFDIEAYIKELKAAAFVIEAGSVMQIPAALDASVVIKKCHPEARVLLCGGGFSPMRIDRYPGWICFARQF
jgi:hypothetical protein